MKKLTHFCAVLLFGSLFWSCSKDSGNNLMKAAISTTCTSAITFNTTDAEAILGTGLFQVSGNTGTDELGINFSGVPVAGTVYDLSSASPFIITLYWDPGDDGIDEYGSSSGQVRILNVDTEGTIGLGGIVHKVELEFSNVTVFKTGGGTLCVNDGYFNFEDKP